MKTLLAGTRRRYVAGLVGVLVLVPLASSPRAASIPIPGKIHIVKDTKLAKMVARPGTVFPVPAPFGAADPTQHGGTLSVVDSGDSGAVFSAALPQSQWTGLGSPSGSAGYKYRGAGVGADPCKIVLVKSSVIKFVCKDDQSLDPPFTGTSQVGLVLGADKYCAEFGGTTVKNDPGLLKRKDAAAPGACPACCADQPFVSFLAGSGSADVGDVLKDDGSTFRQINESQLLFGGGSTVHSNPAPLADGARLVLSVQSCVGDVATLGPTTSAETGSNGSCSDVGCVFGAPLPFPNPSNPALSTCAIVTVSTGVTGSLQCGTGALDIATSLDKAVYLTSDTLTSRCVGGSNPGARCGGSLVCLGGGVCTPDPDLQPCPICNPTTLRCNGGPNGMGSTGAVDTDSPCTPGNSALGAAFPTSHDCPPDLTVLAGNLALLSPVATATTGSVTRTASQLGAIVHGFCGFCRDVDGGGGFGVCAGGSNPGAACLNQGDCFGGGTCGSAQACTASAGCAQPRETCEQRSEGAFGPNGSLARTITATGTSAGDVTDLAAHSATLVSAYCIPPSFTPILDLPADLPGPGALALPGTVKLCASAAACP